jgi:hypothetical protein
MKRFRSSLIALGILAALAAYIWWVEKPAALKKEETQKAEAQVFKFSRENAARVEIQSAAGAVVLERTPAEDPASAVWKWRLVEPLATWADAVRVDDVLRELEDLKSQRRVEGTDMAVFGLDAPPIRVEVKMKDGSVLGLDMGRDAQVERGVYARRRGGAASPVYLLDGYVKTALSRGASELRDRSVVRFESARVRKIEIESLEGRLTLEKNAGRWSLSAPKSMQADREAVDNLLQALEFMNATEIVSERPDAKTVREKNLAPPWMRLTLTERRDAGERKVMAVLGRRKDALFALRDWDGALLRVDSPRWDDLRSRPEYYRRGRLVEFAKWDVEGVEVEGEKSFALEKKDWEWKLVRPKEAEPDRVRMDGLLDALMNLKAADYFEKPSEDAAWGLDKPFLRLRVKGKEGALAEVSFGRKDGKIAARAAGWDGVVLAVDEALVATFLQGHEELLKPSPMPEIPEDEAH